MRIAHVDVRDTVRLVDSRYDDPDAAHAFDPLTDADATATALLVDLATITSARAVGEAGGSPYLPPNLLVAGVPLANVINAAFAYPPGSGTGGGRFNDERIGTWYSSLDDATARAEVEHHRRRFLVEAAIDTAMLSFSPYLADINAQLAVLSPRSDAAVLSKTSYVASQAFARECRERLIPGIAFPSVRRRGGRNIAALVPHVVQHVRRRPPVRVRWSTPDFVWG